MKAISLHQPWASAVVLGLKLYETRHWATNHRGPLAIHAARKQTKPQKRILSQWMLRGDIRPTFEHARIFSWEMLPKGCVIGVVNLQRIYTTEQLVYLDAVSELEHLLGNWGPRRYAWQLTEARSFQPYHIVGRQALFDVPDICVPNE